MPELQWLDGYSGQTVDELIALEGTYRTDSLVLAFEQAIDQKAARDGGEKLSDDEFIILAIAKIAQKAVKIVESAPVTEEEIENGTWEDNDKRQDALNECDNLYFEGPKNIEESLFAFIKANRAKIEL